MKERHEVAKEDSWKVETIYSDLDAWRRDFNHIKSKNVDFFKGKLGEGAVILKTALEEIWNIDRLLAQLHVYIHLKHDENVTDEINKAALGELESYIFDFEAKTSWFEPELLALSEAMQEAYLNHPIMVPYRFYLQRLFRLKNHTRSHAVEELIVLARKAMQTSSRTYIAFNDADLKFSNIKDSNSKEHIFTHALYEFYQEAPDRTLRENSFKEYHRRFIEFENTVAEFLQGAVHKNIFMAKVHHFSSPLEAALFPNAIDVKIYQTLIETVRNNIDALHDYYALREQALHIGQLHIWDQLVPLTESLIKRIPYANAEEMILEAVKPLGDEYYKLLQKGFKHDRWVDRYENKNKRPEAYSSGSYDTSPFILMNYQETLSDVFTLAHETGHSMHSLLANKNQPFHYADYPTFLAEVASAFHEELLFRYLLDQAKTKEEKKYFISHKLDDIRSTLFRQTLFAEFELLIHHLAEMDIPLTPQKLKEEYYQLCQFYYGPSIIVDPEIAIEWARINHFYYNFYVFQYATGSAASLALSERVIRGGKKEQSDYLNFLKSGGSAYPIDILKNAGVDMTTEGPILSAIQTFRRLTQELKELLT